MNWSEELIWKYIDGDCTTNEQAFIEDYMANNANAKSQFQEIASIDTTLKNNVVISSPIDFTDKVMANLQAKPINVLKYMPGGMSAKTYLPFGALLSTLAVLFGLYKGELINTAGFENVASLISGKTAQLVGIIMLCGLFFFALERLLTYFDMRRVNAGF